MEKSQTITEIAKALITFQLKVDKIGKDANNPFFKSKYASLSNIQEAIHIPLAESGLTYSQMPDGENGLTTILIHAESGEYLQSTYDMVPTKNDPQGRGSAITYQKRYALTAILGLNIDDDDDGNLASSRPKQVAEPTTDQKVANMTKSVTKTLTIDELEVIQQSLKLINDTEEFKRFFKALPKDTQTDPGALELFKIRNTELKTLQLA